MRNLHYKLKMRGEWETLRFDQKTMGGADFVCFYVKNAVSHYEKSSLEAENKGFIRNLHSDQKTMVMKLLCV